MLDFPAPGEAVGVDGARGGRVAGEGDVGGCGSREEGGGGEGVGGCAVEEGDLDYIDHCSREGVF